MKNPVRVEPSDPVRTIGAVFGTPLVLKGRTALPLVQIAAWPIMAWEAKRRRPERTWLRSLGVGALTMPVMLGSEWAHNLAHVWAGRLIGKPPDAIRIMWGMPLLVYYDINDPAVTPRQHIFRALGGPLFNLAVLPFALALKSRTRPNAAARDVAEVAAGTNAFIPAVGLLPIPVFDGGPILKWTLVEKGASIPEADAAVRKVNGFLGVVLALAGGLALKQRRWFTGGVLIQLAGMALSMALGWLKEQD